MDKYKRYYGLGAFLVIVALSIYGSYSVIMPKMNTLEDLKNQIEKKKSTLEAKKRDKLTVENKLKKIQDSLATSQKKIYAPIESDLGNDTLFFNLYNDLLDMIKANSVKIKSIEYNYNPEEDPFVLLGGDGYFVCDINLELISNYVDLGNLIQDVYQYPYYIKIKEVNIKPYLKDKKILLTKMNLSMYAHTDPIYQD